VSAGYLNALCDPAIISDIIYLCNRKTGFKNVLKGIQESIKNAIDTII
jgi:hypothetical protein